MTKKNRSILLAVLTMVIGLALVASGTYALFTDQIALANHLQAGTLDVTLTRTKLVTTSLSAQTGFLEETENSDPVDFSDATTRNVFDITDQTLIVPGCKYVAEMQIANVTTEQRKSDVAFGYWLEIKLKTNDEKLKLDEQLRVTVATATGTREALLSEGAILIGEETNPIGVLAKGSSQSFTVSVEFLDHRDGSNNEAKNQALDFDLYVYAVQVPDAP